jgi:hypothetical protein
MVDWGPTVEELRRDDRFALTFKVGRNHRPLTDTERDMVAPAISRTSSSAIGTSSAGPRGAGLHIWGDQSPSELGIGR